MDRSALLVAKQEEVKRQLVQWAADVGLLQDGEFLYCPLFIGRFEDFIVAEPMGQVSNESSASLPLEDEDWEFLDSCEYTNELSRKMIALFREEGNKPMRSEEIESKLGATLARGFSASMRANLKNRTDGNDFVYRFAFVKGDSRKPAKKRRHYISKRRR